MEALERAYAQLDIPFANQSKAGVQVWADSHKRGQHGKHVSHFEDFGLNADQVHTAFAGYTRRFGAMLS